MSAVVGLFAVLVILAICIPLAIYHFLVFPNLDGFLQDVEWFVYDSDSQNFIYWLFFWTIVFFGSKSTSATFKKD